MFVTSAGEGLNFRVGPQTTYDPPFASHLGVCELQPRGRYRADDRRRPPGARVELVLTSADDGTSTLVASQGFAAGSDPATANPASSSPLSVALSFVTAQVPDGPYTLAARLSTQEAGAEDPSTSAVLSVVVHNEGAGSPPSP